MFLFEMDEEVSENVESSESYYRKSIKASQDEAIVDDNIIMTVEKMLRDDGIWADAIYDERSNLAFYIKGDWKHDHLRADYLVEDYFNKLGYDVEADEEVTEETYEDYYPAIHIYKIYPQEWL